MFRKRLVTIGFKQEVVSCDSPFKPDPHPSWQFMAYIIYLGHLILTQTALHCTYFRPYKSLSDAKENLASQGGTVKAETNEFLCILMM